MIYLANAFSVNMLGDLWCSDKRTVHIERISAKETGDILNTQKWQSFFGHENSAWHLSRYLRMDIPVNRGTFIMTPADTLIAAAVEGRRRWEDGRRRCPQWRFFRVTIEKEKAS